jgi:hypothetical protein
MSEAPGRYSENYLSESKWIELGKVNFSNEDERDTFCAINGWSKQGDYVRV